jgi:hypothetical protein
MQITINNVDVQDKGKYKIAVVEYLNQEGRSEKKNVVSFGNKALYATLSAASKGEVFDVKLNKNDKGYWEFTEATKSEGSSSSSQSSKTGATASPRSTYETPEERAARQVYIIRQSSLSTAVNVLSVGAKSVKLDDVLATAKVFEDYVFGKSQVQEPGVASLATLTDDFPDID